MQLPPIDVVITWPRSNYLNPSEVRGPAVFILTLIFVPLLVILVGTRVYTRLCLTKNFGYDDIAIVLAVVPTLGCAVVTLLAVKYHGWDRHVWDLPAEELVMALKLAMVVAVLFSIGCSLTRISILFLICRIMTAGHSIYRKIAIGLIVLMCIEETIFCIVAINTCSPVSDYWTLSKLPQKCINEAAHFLAAGIINTFNDFCVVLLPIPVVMKLNLPLRQRVFCALLFGAGFIVCIAGGVRIAFMWQLNTTYDKTWLAEPTWICGTIELYLGIIVTSLPAIKPLVTRYFPTLLGNNHSTHALSAVGESRIHETHQKILESPRLKSSLVEFEHELCDMDAQGGPVSGLIKRSVHKDRGQSSSPRGSENDLTSVPVRKNRRSHERLHRPLSAFEGFEYSSRSRTLKLPVQREPPIGVVDIRGGAQT